MNRLIKNDLNAVKSKYKDERRTLIQEGTTSFEVDKKALISKDEVMVVFTKDGYFKRTQMRSYTSSNGQLPGFKQGDVIKGIIKCYTTDTLLAFTNFGTKNFEMRISLSLNEFLNLFKNSWSATTFFSNCETSLNWSSTA